MRIVRSWEVKGVKVEPPYERTLKVLMSPDTHGVRGLSIGMVIIPPGSMSDRHSHEENEEYWIVVDGYGEIEVSGEKAKLEPGVIVYAPPGKSHQLFNPFHEPLKAYYIFTPPGPERNMVKLMESKGS